VQKGPKLASDRQALGEWKRNRPEMASPSVGGTRVLEGAVSFKTSDGQVSMTPVWAGADDVKLVPPQAVLSMAQWKELLVTREPGAVRIWNLNDMKLVKAYPAAARHMLLLRDTLVVSLSEAETHLCRCYDMTNLERPPLELQGHQGWISSSCMSPSPLPMAVFTTSTDATAKKWVIPDPTHWSETKASSPRVRPAAQFLGHTDYVTCCAISGNGNSLFTGSCDNTVRKWSTKDGQQEVVYTGHEGWVNCVVWADNRLFSCAQDGTVREWSPESASCVRTFDVTHSCLELCVYAMSLYVVDVNQRVSVFDLAKVRVDAKGRVESRAKVYVGHTGRITQFDVEPSTYIILTSSKDGTLRRWLPGKAEAAYIYQGHKGPVTCFLRVGERLFSGGQDGTILMWSLPGKLSDGRVRASVPPVGSPLARAAVRCQAVVRATRAQRFVKRNRHLFPGAADRLRAARSLALEESNHVRSVTDAMGFKKAFVEGSHHANSWEDPLIEKMFDLLVEMQALHAVILSSLSKDIDSSWPFVGQCGQLLMQHLPRLLTLSHRYVSAYHRGLQEAHKALAFPGSKAIQLVKEQELVSGVTLESVLELPFTYFSKQVAFLKTLGVHSQHVPDFASLLDALTRYQAASSDLTEMLLRTKNRSLLAAEVDQALPGLRVHPEVERTGVFLEGKPIGNWGCQCSTESFLTSLSLVAVKRGEAKSDRGKLVLFLFTDMLLFGTRAKGSNKAEVVREAIPMSEARLVWGTTQRSLLVEWIGHKKVELVFKTTDLCKEWAAALTHEADVARCRMFGVSLEELALRDGCHVPWLISYVCKMLQASADHTVFQLLLARVERRALFEFRALCNTPNPKMDPATVTLSTLFNVHSGRDL
jgi:WD40 repeat protein